MGKKTRFQRVNGDIEKVTITLPEIYGDEPLTLPSNNRLPNKVVRALLGENFEPLFEWLRTNGTDKETMDALEELTFEEFSEFVQAWSKAGVDLPK